MNAVTGFVAIVSLLLALAAGGGEAKPQAGGTCPPWMCGSDGNHNETLVVDTAPMNSKEKSSCTQKRVSRAD